MGPLPDLILLLDHDNLPGVRSDLGRLVGPWLARLESTGQLPRGRETTASLHARFYGGWFDGYRVSQSRYQAGQEYDTGWPALLQRPGYLLRITFEFSEDLLGAGSHPKHKITNTVAFRGRPIRANPTPLAKTCPEPACERKKVQQWIKRGSGCTLGVCPNTFIDCFQRHEQKQVDIHLALDLISLTSGDIGSAHIAIATDDLDFAPALLRAAHSIAERASLTLIRTIRKPLYCDETLRGLGATIVYISEDIAA